MVPLISVVVPVYKVESYLRPCIDSILSQTFRNFELLLVDDGSPDGSGEICEAYAAIDDRVKVFHISNGGPGAARNFGLERVQAEWVCFIDSDDVVEEGYLEAFFRYGIPDKYCLEMQGMEYVDSTGEKSFKQVIYPDLLLMERNLSEGIAQYQILHSGGPCLKLFNTGLIKEYSLAFNTMLHFHEDHIFYLQYFYRVKSIRLLSDVKYRYRQVQGSLTHRIHPHERIEMAYRFFTKELERVIGRFEIKDLLYLKMIRHDVCGIYVRAIGFCYKQKTKRQERINFLRRSKLEKNKIKAYYQPVSFRERIWKYIVVWFPVYLEDLILKIIYSWK